MGRTLAPSVPTVPIADPYDDQEVDPLKTGAIDSSLWEIATMRSHYAPSVSTLAKIFEEAFTKPNYDMDDFLDHTYSTVSGPTVLGHDVPAA